MVSSENSGAVTRLHLAFKRIVERSHDAVFVLPRQSTANPDGYAADISGAIQEFEQLAKSLPEEISNWTDDKFEQALQEAGSRDTAATERLNGLMSRVEACQKVVRTELRNTCRAINGPMCTVNLEADGLGAQACVSQPTADGPRLTEKAPNRAAEPTAFSDSMISAPQRKPETRKPPLPQPLLRELVTDRKRRFTEELEFLLLLADPYYVNWLALQGYFQDDAFINFLKYLEYWREWPYAQWVIYPQALRMLQMLQDPIFREKVKLPDVCEWLARQNVYKSLEPEIVEPRRSAESRCKVCKTPYFRAELACRECGECRQPNETLSTAVPSTSSSNHLDSEGAHPSSPSAANRLGGFRPWQEPQEVSAWTHLRLNAKREAETSICEYWEKRLKKRHAEKKRSELGDPELFDFFIKEEVNKQVRNNFPAVADIAPDSSWKQLLLPVTESEKNAASRPRFDAVHSKLRAKLHEDVPDRGSSHRDMYGLRDFVESQNVNESVPSTVGASVVSVISVDSGGSGSTGGVSGPTASIEGMDSAATSGSGHSSRTSNDLAKAQSQANATNPIFHGEWEVLIKPGSIWGKAYVAPSQCYLAPHKKHATGKKQPNIPLSITGDGTDASPFVIKAKGMKPATLLENRERSLIWLLHDGKTSTWSRPS